MIGKQNEVAAGVTADFGNFLERFRSIRLGGMDVNRA